MYLVHQHIFSFSV